MRPWMPRVHEPRFTMFELILDAVNGLMVLLNIFVFAMTGSWFSGLAAVFIGTLLVLTVRIQIHRVRWARERRHEDDHQQILEDNKELLDWWERTHGWS